MSVYDLAETPIKNLEADKRYLQSMLDKAEQTSVTPPRVTADITEDLQEVTEELARREATGEPEVYVEACVGGCGKVYDLPEPRPAYVCRRCSMMGRA